MGSDRMTRSSFRKRLYTQLAPDAWRREGLSPTNWLVCALILVSAGVAVIATEPAWATDNRALFRTFELTFGVIFLVEYAARLWVSAETPGAGSAARRRLRFVFSPSALIDLAVLIVTFVPFILANGQVLRLVRLLRIVRLAKLGRLSAAMRHLIAAIASRRDELIVTLALAACLLVFGATALHWAEGSVQPDKFGSIPRALWWSIVTLTTIGYGDVYPITPLGKVLAGFVALAGIGLIAMPTGILAAAFSDAVQRERERTGKQ